VEEFQLSEDPRQLGHLSGRSLADLEIKRRTGVLVLAVKQPSEPIGASSYRVMRQEIAGERLIANPPVETRLAPGQLLVVLGSRDQLARLRKLLGVAVVQESAMPG